MTKTLDMQLNRRAVIGGLAGMTVAPNVPALGMLGRAEAAAPVLDWIVSTKSAPWQQGQGARLVSAATGGFADVYVNGHARQQTIEGFGACFNELGWDALSVQRPDAREAVFKELFGRTVLVSQFAVCRSGLTTSRGTGIPMTRCRRTSSSRDFRLPMTSRKLCLRSPGGVVRWQSFFGEGIYDVPAVPVCFRVR